MSAALSVFPALSANRDAAQLYGQTNTPERISGKSNATPP